MTFNYDSRRPDSRSLQTLVDERIDSWREGEEPDASRFLAEHPELRGAKSLVMDIALAEWTLRTEAGDKIEKSDFCDRFPAYRQSIAKMLEVQEFLDQCPQFAIQESSRWPKLDDAFLGFEIVEPLGRGGLARVYLAKELSLGNRQVVVKVSRFASREAHTLGKLSHPSIMPIHSVQHDDDEGWTAICMPLLGAATGVDLLDAAFSENATRDGELVRRIAEETRPLNAKTLISSSHERFAWDLTYQQAIGRIGLQLAEALAAAHSNGILHRDIKPSNILLAWSGRPVLLDFNLSSDASTTLQGVGGTLAYMAPEVIASVLSDKGQAARQFDPRLDIYSLGAVLFELLTGQLPAKPENADRLPIDAYEPWLDCKREPLATFANDHEYDAINQPLFDIVKKCLSFDPAERYATADELVQALQTYLESLKPAPVIENAPVRPTAPAKRFTLRVALVAVAAIVLLGFGVSFSGSQAPRITPPEVLYQQGLDEYDNGQYEKAIETFTLCLERRAGWPEALFARGQAHRRLGQYAEARTDFTGLEKSDARWAYALAGYCSMQASDDSAAWGYYLRAYNNGQRDVRFLFNYARVLTRKQRPTEAIACFNDILEAEPGNLTAWYNRCLSGVSEVWNQKKLLPSAETMARAEEYVKLAPANFDSTFCAAAVFGEAARKDVSYRDKAVSYLTDALKQGLPLEVSEMPGYRLALTPLMGFVDAKVIENGIHDPAYRIKICPVMDFPLTADWQQFRNPEARRGSSVVRGTK